MFGGSWAGDMAANGARKDAMHAHQSAQIWEQNAGEWKEYAEKMVDSAAEYVVVREALANQLENVDPKNPLLTDRALVERVKAAGVSTLHTTKLDFEAVREVGRTFKIPGRENGPPPVTAAPKVGLALRDDATKLKHDYAGLVALRDALVRQLLIVDPTNPLLADSMLQMRVRAAGQTAYIMNGEDFESARQAGKTFAIPGRE